MELTWGVLVLGFVDFSAQIKREQKLNLLYYIDTH